MTRTAPAVLATAAILVGGVLAGSATPRPAADPAGPGPAVGVELRDGNMIVNGTTKGDYIEIRIREDGSVEVRVDTVVTAVVTADQLGGPTASVSVFAYTGDDIVRFSASADLYRRRADAGHGADLVEGSAFADVLEGGAGPDKVDGGGGDDAVWGFLELPPKGPDGKPGKETDPNTLRGGPGNDSLYGDDGIDTIEGDDGDDVLYGESGDDLLFGGAGVDQLYGGEGDDKLDGGPGRDHLEGDLEPEEGRRALGDGPPPVHGDDILMGRGGNDVLRGNGGADCLDGGGGRDVLRGQAGPDLLVADDGTRDSVHGGSGSDAARYDERRDDPKGIETRTNGRCRVPGPPDPFGFPPPEPPTDQEVVVESLTLSHYHPLEFPPGVEPYSLLCGSSRGTPGATGSLTVAGPAGYGFTVPFDFRDDGGRNFNARITTAGSYKATIQLEGDALTETYDVPLPPPGGPAVGPIDCSLFPIPPGPDRPGP